MSGRLGIADLAATTDTTIYAVPGTKIATVNVSFCNRGGAAAKIRLAMVDGAVGDLADEDYLEYDADVPANGVLERTGIALSGGETVIARSDVVDVSVRVHGFEEAE